MKKFLHLQEIFKNTVCLCIAKVATKFLETFQFGRHIDLTSYLFVHFVLTVAEQEKSLTANNLIFPKIAPRCFQTLQGVDNYILRLLLT